MKQPNNKKCSFFKILETLIEFDDDGHGWSYRWIPVILDPY